MSISSKHLHDIEAAQQRPLKKGVRQQLYDVIFGTESNAGQNFDIVLLCLIVVSVLVVILESIESYRVEYQTIFKTVEIVFTIIFSIEYLVRLWIVRDKSKYATSFFGIVDLMSILPTFISFFLPGSQYLITIRSLRLLRIFRILKLGRFIGEGAVIVSALRASVRKIMVFIGAVLTVVLFVGSAMYIVEANQDSGFDSIPRSIYWAIVTITTVGYGDIAPATKLGQFIAAVLMIIGYGIIAVPTGIVTVEMNAAQKATKDDKGLAAQANNKPTNTQVDYKANKNISDTSTTELAKNDEHNIYKFIHVVCNNCGANDHHIDAHYCYNCGVHLETIR